MSSIRLEETRTSIIKRQKREEQIARIDGWQKESNI